MPDRQYLGAASSDSALTRFHNLAPYFPRCSMSNDAALSRPRHLAVRYPHMQVNRADMVSWLVFDLDDYPDWFSWEDVDLPAPNLVVKHRGKNSAHWFYAITPVNTGDNGRDRPVAYMRAVYNAMKVRLRYADLAYGGGPVAKTPGHRFWSTIEVHRHEYSLGELAEYLDIDGPTPWKPRGDADQLWAELDSRHQWLFHFLRFKAYPVVQGFRDRGDFQSFYRSLLLEAGGANSFRARGWAKGNLTDAQVRATTKSVARWTWEKYRGVGRCARGVMQLDESLTVQERQRLAARRTHAERRSQTLRRVEAACLRLISAGARLSFTAIAEEAGLSRQTVSKHRDRIDALSSTSTDTRSGHKSRDSAAGPESNSQTCRQPGASSPGPAIVTFAAHQITTCRSWPRQGPVVVPLASPQPRQSKGPRTGGRRGKRGPPDPTG